MKNDFCFLSGEDGTALAFLAQGGHGCISVTANVAPRLCSDLHQAWREKNIDKAQELKPKISQAPPFSFFRVKSWTSKICCFLIRSM
jgi:dihydrodipicolinate synthase/N-acetylneuraminate lyase